MRDLSRLPKAHLHLHFTGAMRLETLVDLAQASRTRLPSSFIDGDPLRVPADHRGWFRFQRAYDTARHLVTTEETMRRIVLEAALDDAAEGSRRLEIQVDPTSYAPFVGGLTPALEIVLDAAGARRRSCRGSRSPSWWRPPACAIPWTRAPSPGSQPGMRGTLRARSSASG